MAPKKKDASTSVSNAERCRRWRQLKKGDQDYIEQERKRKADYRGRMNPEQVDRSRQASRERMRKYRKRKKEEIDKVGNPSPSPKKEVMTRQMTETQRQKWQKRKQEYRAKLTGQKKRRIGEKDASAKREKREHSTKQQPTDKPCSTFSTAGAKRTAVCRSKKHLPKDPKKFVPVMKTIIDSASPKKRKLLTQHKLLLTPSKRKRVHLLEKNVESLKSTLEALKANRSASSIKQRRFVLHHMSKTLKKHKTLLSSCKELGIRYKTMVKWSRCLEELRKRRSDVLKHEDHVKDFFVKPYVSVIHAEKKTVRGEKQEQTLNQTLKDTHEMYMKENPEKTVSFSKFAKLKPGNVKTVDKQNFRTCLCEKCVNIELLLKAINKAFPGKKIRDRYEACKITMCQYEKQAKLDCVQRKCECCGVMSGLQDYIAEENETLVSWYKWQTVKVKNKKTKKEMSKKALVTGSVQDLLNEFAQCLEAFSIHIFEATRQYR